jgi:hypothetical protein
MPPWGYSLCFSPLRKTPRQGLVAIPKTELLLAHATWIAAQSPAPALRAGEAPGEIKAPIVFYIRLV